jgi:hypothetical protein
MGIKCPIVSFSKQWNVTGSALILQFHFHPCSSIITLRTAFYNSSERHEVWGVHGFNGLSSFFLFVVYLTTVPQ